MARRALVVLSGGQDSTTCLYWAKARGDEIHAITFGYGQRHIVEADSARQVAAMAGVKSHEFYDFGPGVLKGTSPLVDRSRDVGQYQSAAELPGGTEPTFVPGRNILFLTVAANRAAVIGADSIVTGLCEEDYGGYPDCRQEYVDAMARALSLGVYGEPDRFKIETPLMKLTKRATVEMARGLPGCWEALAKSHTCYRGDRPACGKCHACILRARGFAEAGEKDPAG